MAGEEPKVDQTESDWKDLQQAQYSEGHDRKPEINHGVEHDHAEGHDVPQETQRHGCYGPVHVLQHGGAQGMQEEYGH
jgi:hypothetical protein